MIFGKDRGGRTAAGTPSGDSRLPWRLPERGGSQAAPAERGATLPRFAVAATDDLGEAAQGLGDNSPARARLALADALSASQPVTSRERFAGRHDTLAALIAAIEQQRAHVVLYGERGIGKTSLIHVFAETAREARYLVLYGSCGVEARFDEMFRTFASEIPLLYHSQISPTGDETEHNRSFADLLGEGPVDPRELADLFQRIVGTRVIIVLDEYDRVADPAFRRDVAELIKNLSDRAARVQLVLTGVASNLDELIGFTPSIRRNIVGLAVGPMAESELSEILSRAEEATGLTFAAPARALILRMAGGSPYLARLLGNRAAGRALDDRRTSVTEADVIAGTEAVLVEWNAGLPRRVQAQLQRPEVRSAWNVLIAASRASGTPDGWFGVHDVGLEGDIADPAKVESVLSGLTGEIDLFDREEAGDGREARFRFRTQGVAQLLGLSAALARAGR
ncbi:ATP-binding protein [Sandaracinobacter sp. RS1-74]|uniref:AAA family ATPase n=1 Tax=Sandaracinobacteroides sayramensis TaxID=2913411 RepID=UPI001ED9D8A2|nr:ATP-binding protein [Sandaracinobacteroides sayramensis]MCG2840237.1 ATP-binding protein [Sandaracinobacteroides sayramensis]